MPGQEDEPEANFFFAQQTDGGRLMLDLGKAIDVKQINTYSWHPNTRGPQVYKLYVSDGTAAGFKADPKRGTDPTKVGWKLIATVDTRRRTRTKWAGNMASAPRTPPAVHRQISYVLFDIKQTEDDDAFGNTFYSEINVIEKK